MLIGTAAFEFLPNQLLGFFNASPEMLHIGRNALRIIGLHFPIAAFSIILISVFQALGQGVISMIVSFVRQIIVLLPMAWLLSLSGNVNNVWWSFPIAEIAAVTISSLFMIKLYKKNIKNLPE